MAETRHLREVFGISRDLPLNYVARDDVDGRLVDSLTRDKHIVIYGSSKQGKTSLRKYNLLDDDYIVVTCSNRWSLHQLHSTILKAAGYTVEQSTTRTTSGDTKIAAKIGGGISLRIIKLEAEIGSEESDTDTVTTEELTLELDPTDANDIIFALDEIHFGKYIVLEDFHYLPQETQEDFAVALKAFHESSDLCFIVVGVWLDENRLIQYNGDLTGRVITINADAWSDAQLREVVAKGAQLLNVTFDPGFVTGVVEGSNEAVYVVQEACYAACEQSGVAATLLDSATIGGAVDPVALIGRIVDAESARYNSFISSFAQGFIETTLEMYKWLLLPVLVTGPEQLESGLSWNAIRKWLSENHPEKDKLNPGNITQALISSASLQVKKRITPIVVDYNATRKQLNVVDRGFLIWLRHQTIGDLLTTAGLSTTYQTPSDL